MITLKNLDNQLADKIGDRSRIELSKQLRKGAGSQLRNKLWNQLRTELENQIERSLKYDYTRKFR